MQNKKSVMKMTHRPNKKQTNKTNNGFYSYF